MSEGKAVQVWAHGDHEMLAHAVGVIRDRMWTYDGYTEEDEETVAKLEGLARMIADENSAVLMADLSKPPHFDDAYMMLQDIVRLELKHWVPDASQGVIRRASVMLDLPVGPVPPEADHGPNPGDHALFGDWAAGLYVLKCSTCNRLFLG